MEMRWVWLLQDSIRARHWGINKLRVLRGGASSQATSKKQKVWGAEVR